MERIMVATDGSAGADRAVAFAVRLAQGLQTELLIVTVEEEFGTGDMRRIAHVEGDVGGAIDSAAGQIVAPAALLARRSGATAVRTSIVWGDPAEALMEAIDRERPSMIVVGRRGRGRLAGLLLGSVSQKLTLLATCAVLVIP